MGPIHILIGVIVVVMFIGGRTDATSQPRHGIAMHGEPKYQAADFRSFDYVNPEAPKGGTVRRHVVGTFNTLNPFIVKGVPAAGVLLTYDSLMTPSADERFTMYGLLAEGVTVAEDRSWVTFKLRAEARWHDGKPVTADDVIWTFETLTTKAVPYYRGYYEDVKTAEQLGDRTVRFTFANDTNRELPLILGQLLVLPKHYWLERDITKTTLEPPLGSGPYRISRLQPGRYVEYDRMADYWGKDLPVNVGRHNFDIRYEYFRDDTVAAEAFKSGVYDYRVENSSKSWATAYEFAALRKGLVKKEEIPHGRSTNLQGFAFNTRRPPFDNRKVREALAYAFDFERSNRMLFHGQYARTRSYFGIPELAATGPPSPAELAILEPYRSRLPEEVFTQAYKPPATDGPEGIHGNLAKARDLLGEAGWRIDKNTRKLTHETTGRTMQFEFLLRSRLFLRVVNPFVWNLELLGISANVPNPVDSATYWHRLSSFDFDIVVQTWSGSFSPGNEQRERWGSSYADRPGSDNVVGIRDPVLDELLEKMINASDRESHVDHVRALDRVLQWGHFLIPHWHLTYDRIAYWDRFGRPGVTPFRGVQLETWWIDSKKAEAVKSQRNGG